MAADRKLWRVTMIIDHGVMHDVMMLVEGKCIGKPEMVPVRHGGADEHGKLQPPPSSRDFVLNYLAEHGTLALKDAQPVGDKLGITKGAITQALYKLMDERTVKRIDTGVYVLNEAKLKKVPQLTHRKPVRRHTTNPGPGESLPDRLMSFIRSKQNGSGEGVSLQEIRKHLATLGYAGTSAGTSLTKLVAAHELVRVGVGAYRAKTEQQPAPAAH